MDFPLTFPYGRRDLSKNKVKYNVFKMEFDDNDRAILEGKSVGFVKVFTSAGTDKILAATIVGENAGNLISEITVLSFPAIYFLIAGSHHPQDWIVYFGRCHSPLPNSSGRYSSCWRPVQSHEVNHVCKSFVPQTSFCEKVNIEDKIKLALSLDVKVLSHKT